MESIIDEIAVEFHDVCISSCKNYYIRLIDRQMDRHIDELMDGWMDRHIDGWMNG